MRRGGVKGDRGWVEGWIGGGRGRIRREGRRHASVHRILSTAFAICPS
jgi:hypothetical protein